MSTLLQTTDNDIAITVGKLTVVTDPAQSTAIKLNNRFRLFLGEWFLDTRIGVPYLQFILGIKNPDIGVIRQIFKQVITGCPGVASVTSLDVEVDRATRVLTFSFVCKSDGGKTITGGSGQPFIVQDTN